MHNISNLFWNNTLHVSDGLSVHHQDSKTVHTASGICHTRTGPVAVAGKFPLASRQQKMFDMYLMLYVQS